MLVVAIALVVGGGSEDSDRAADAEAKGAKLPKLGRSFSSSSAGIEGRVPRGWRARRVRGTIRLRSRDATTAISLSAPARAGDAPRVLSDSLAEIRSRYPSVTASRPVARRLAGLPARYVRVSAVNKRGTAFTALVATARGKRRTYLAEVFSGAGAPARRLVEAQRILNGLELRR